MIGRDAFAGWTDFTRCADVKQAAAPRNLRSTIPDNDDCLRCFRGLDGFLASRGRETGCRFAGFYVQPFRTTVIGRDAFAGWANFLRRANVKQAAASRNLRSIIPNNDDCPRRFREMGGFPALCGRETGCRFARFYVQAFRTMAIGRDAFAEWTNFLRRADVKQTAASRSFTFSHSGQRRFRRMDGFSFPRGRYVQAFRTTIRLLRSVCTVRRTFRRRCGAGFSYL